ncbi:P-loop containing nucleoside triphosphate hydrolase protein [Phyllosticta capitalensis]
MIVERTVVQVNGQVLRNALRNIFRESEGFTLTKDQGVELEDIRFMYWAKPELELLRKHYQSQEDAISLFEIEAGLTFIQTEWAHTHAAVESLLPSSIRFDYLWTIFTPDSLLVGKDALGSRTIWRVRSGNQLKTEKGYAFAITTEHVEWNGERMDMVKRVVKIDQFFGTIALEDLPVMPLRYHPQALLIVEKILERSDKKMVFCEKGHQFRDHNGLCLTAGFSRADEPVLHHYSGRIMVDLEMMHQVEPNNVLLPSLVKFRIPRVFMSDVTSDEQEILSHLLRDPNKLEGFSTDNHSVNNESEMLVAEKGKEEGTLKRSMIMERRLLLSGMLFGYFLSDAKWGAFSIDRVSEIKWNETVFDSLVMKQSLKNIIFRLVTAHSSRTSDFDDFVKGKGKGLVGLLQGPPGSGKTLTAEAIAETAKMPLYTISSGALGTGPVEIHKSLVKILHLAAHWKAVLLLDEADVFLTKRTMADVSRNAIVSIFLSELEYYQGILLLTTNKAQDIDEAFKSRIHFCHSYPNLDFAARKTIWQDFMKRTQETQTGVSVDVTDDGIEKLAEMPLNGRQVSHCRKKTKGCAAWRLTTLSCKLIRSKTQ